MQITLLPPLAIHKKGKRDYNQDNVYPNASAYDKTSDFFLVCDGVGGSSKGEIASKLICETFEDFFISRKDFSNETLKEALSEAVKAMNQYIDS